MTDVPALRAAIAGLIGFAAGQEQVLLAAAPQGEEGGPSCWAALPLIAHNTEFRRQQVQRLRAIRSGQAPPEFAEVDHRSPDLYAELEAQPADAVGRDSWRVSGELIEELSSVSQADLLDPSLNPWLRGRQLWLQLIVRGFWHPAGHLGSYYLSHGQAGRAISLAEQAVKAAAVLGAPVGRGMASYNLACAQAGHAVARRAAATVSQAVALNPDVRANAPAAAISLQCATAACSPRCSGVREARHMYEEQADITWMPVLDRSLTRAGEHLHSIIRADRAVPARDLIGQLTGMRTLALSTVSPGNGASGVDGHLLRGRWIFTTSGSSVKAADLRTRPTVSAAYLEATRSACSPTVTQSS